MVVDAAVFLPQSRPHLFVIGVCREAQVPRMLAGAGQRSIFHTGSLAKAFRRLPERLCQEWIWWKLPVPPVRSTQLADLIEESPTSVSWHHPDETAKLLNLMNERHRAKVKAMQRLERRVVGTVYRRTCTDSNGAKALRAEVRFDGVAGCLRTPTGGQPTVGTGSRRRTNAIAFDVKPGDGSPHGVARQLQRGLPPDRRWRRGAGGPVPCEGDFGAGAGTQSIRLTLHHRPTHSQRKPETRLWMSPRPCRSRQRRFYRPGTVNRSMKLAGKTPMARTMPTCMAGELWRAWTSCGRC